MISSCENCATEISVFPYQLRTGKGRFCSARCRQSVMNKIRRRPSPIKRFFSYVQLDLKRGCWLWLGALNMHGYGQFHDESRRPTNNIHAFRWSYEYFKGQLPEGHEPDHLCRIRSCVNPDHLEGVTRRVNTLRSTCPAAINARKIVCKHGHNEWALTKEGRYCRACKRINVARRKRRLAAVLSEQAKEVREGGRLQ